MRQATGRAALGAEEDLLLRRRTIAHLVLLTLLGATTLLGPSAMAIDGVLPTTRQIIEPNHEQDVLKLVAPWQEGEQVAGYRWEGVRIERFAACYLFSRGTEPAEVCIVASDGAGDYGGVPTFALPYNALAALAKPRPAGPEAEAVLQAVGARIVENAAAGNLRMLWSRARSEIEKGPQLPPPDDVLLWLPALLIWLLFASARSLRGLPGGGWAWTLGLLALSAALRFEFPVQAPMTAWPWSRWTRLLILAEQSTLLRSLLDEYGAVSALSLQSELLRLTAIFTPLAIVGHSRKLFGARWPALAAGVLLAVSPHHLRFAAADVQFIPSMLWSSAAFLWLYETLEARQPVMRAVHLAGLVPLLYLSLSARPLNIAYAPLMLAALAMAAQHASMRWRLTVATPVVVAAGLAVAQLLSASKDAVSGAFEMSSIWSMLTLPLRADYNPILYFRLTPPIWFGLIVLGAALMLLRPKLAIWRRPDEDELPTRIVQLRGLWLCGWLIGFIMLHGVVVVPEPMNNARYQLHSLPAMAMLAGLGWTALWQLGRERTGARLAAAAAGLIALSAPWWMRPAIADVDFVTMRERAFLQESFALLPEGCEVLEVSAGRDGSEGHGRLPHVLRTIRGFRPTQPRWLAEVIDANHPEAGEKVRQALAKHPRCQAFYEGVACQPGPQLPGRRRVCSEVLAGGEWAMMAERSFATRIYDEGETAHLRADGDPIQLRLWRRIYGPAAHRPSRKEP